MHIHYAREILKLTVLSTVRPTNQRSFSKTVFKLEQFENGDLELMCETENIFKTELSEYGDITIIRLVIFLTELSK